MKRIALAEFPASYRTTVLSLLARSQFADPSKRRHAVVVCTPERREVIHRLEFAAELRGAGLEDEAREIAHEVLRAGEVLGYVLKDDADGCVYAAAVLTLPGWKARG